MPGIVFGGLLDRRHAEVPLFDDAAARAGSRLLRQSRSARRRHALSEHHGRARRRRHPRFPACSSLAWWLDPPRAVRFASAAATRDSCRPLGAVATFALLFVIDSPRGPFDDVFDKGMWSAMNDQSYPRRFLHVVLPDRDPHPAARRRRRRATLRGRRAPPKIRRRAARQHAPAKKPSSIRRSIRTSSRSSRKARSIRA